MGIRRVNKNQLATLAPALAIAVPAANPDSDDPSDPLVFWTSGTSKPQLINLQFLRNGESTRAGPGGAWLGPFSGRPTLSKELGPVLREVLMHAEATVVSGHIAGMRSWMRLFDRAVSRTCLVGSVQTVSDIGELHRQLAYDQGMPRLQFSNGVRVFNLARAASGLKQLYWKAPEQPGKRQDLPPQAHFDAVRFELKHRWFSTLDRWIRASQLLAQRNPENADEERLLKNYERFELIRADLRVRNILRRPNRFELMGDLTIRVFLLRGFFIADMIAGFYPSSADIKVAFHLCLANTGWNPQILLDLDAEHCLQTHPKDTLRWLLNGHKNRGDSDHSTEGLWKSQGSAGAIIQTLINTTAYLRESLKKDLSNAKVSLAKIVKDRAPADQIAAAQKLVMHLSEGVRSVWLYASSSKPEYLWLTSSTFAKSAETNLDTHFLGTVIAEINNNRPSDNQISRFTSTDFRDAFAAFAYRISGGMILYVMKILRHKSPSTTQAYLDNNLLNSEGATLYRVVQNNIWSEIRSRGAVDPTVLAKLSRDGGITIPERQKLADYRTLRKSRIGVGCLDPHNPPRNIAPNFKSDGISTCHVHRCCLCFENAIILPSSIDGLCKRVAELEHIQKNMGYAQFVASSFDQELHNTRAALTNFAKIDVDRLYVDWITKITSGQHRVIDMDGAQ